MKLYDAAFDPVINETADNLVNALVLVVAVNLIQLFLMGFFKKEG